MFNIMAIMEDGVSKYSKNYDGSAWTLGVKTKEPLKGVQFKSPKSMGKIPMWCCSLRENLTNFYPFTLFSISLRESKEWGKKSAALSLSWMPQQKFD